MPLESTDEVVAGDAKLQALPGDFIRLTYTDTLNITAGPRDLTRSAKCVEGNLGGVRVTRTQINDAELALKTKLKTASALTQIGNQYRDFGLDAKAKLKYEEALGVCEEIAENARKRAAIFSRKPTCSCGAFISMDRLNLAAAMSLRLQRSFPRAFILMKPSCNRPGRSER